MPTCPCCHSPQSFPSHRRGLLERGALTWIGLLPYRCGQCGRRFLRFAPRDFRRLPVEGREPGARLRPSRWPLRLSVDVRTPGPEGPDLLLRGRTANVSLEGIQLRLPASLPPGTPVGIQLEEGEPPRLGRVRWSGEPAPNPGTAHGVQFDEPAGRRLRPGRPYRRLLWRQRLRRAGLALLGLLLIAAASYALVWLLEAFRVYDPKYYEPKDMERQHFEQPATEATGKVSSRP